MHSKFKTGPPIKVRDAKEIGIKMNRGRPRKFTSNVGEKGMTTLSGILLCDHMEVLFTR